MLGELFRGLGKRRRDESEDDNGDHADQSGGVVGMVDAPLVPPQRNIAVPKSSVAVAPVFGSMSATVEVEAQRTLEKMYRGLAAIWTNESMFPATAQKAHENRLELKKADPRPELMKSRYEHADSDSVLRREFLVIALCSPAFSKSIAFDNYY